jgi:hypothetical protein
MPADDATATLEARLDLLDLEGEYARTWDTGDAEGWAALFTEDGVFEMVGVGDLPGTRVEGQQQLVGFCRQIHESYEGLHLLHAPSLILEGERARGWIHFEFRFLHRMGDAAELGDVAGVYQVAYLRTPAGWRIQHRVEQAVARSSGAFYGVPRGPRDAG